MKASGLLVVALVVLILIQALSSSNSLVAQTTISIIRVPQDADLQTAIQLVEDGGVIEISGGTYPSPNGGFVISDLGKSFTIQAAPGETVVLDGEGQREIITFINTNIARGGLVTFQDIVFTNGKATTDGRAGAVTMQRAKARFIRCTFSNNQGQQPSTGGGAVLVAIGSEAAFENCVWDSNTARNFGGGLAVNDHAEAVIHDSIFNNNRTNVGANSPSAAGGAIHVGNSMLWVYNSHFYNNQAGYVGGAIYAIGEWQNYNTFVLIADSVFTNNLAISAYPLSLPTEGGAFHAENQTEALILRSQFTGNQAMIGGAISAYRASVNIAESQFQNNVAYGIGAANGMGGSIAISSNDTPSDGNVNYPSARLTIRDSVFTGPASAAAQSGGAIYIAGDGNRNYGINGVSQEGTPSENRAVAILERVVISGTVVQEQTDVPGTGIGGAVMTDLADLTIKDSLFILNNAVGLNNSSGGALAIINDSVARLENVTIAYNSSGKFGGGIFVQGSEIQARDCSAFGNEISSREYGSVIFAAPDESRNLDVHGSLNSCVMTENIGLLIFDDDRDIPGGPINDVLYNANQIYISSNQGVYKNALVGTYDVEGLNSLVVIRPKCGRNTKKSQIPNTQLINPPPAGTLVAISPYIIPQAAGGKHYLGFAWKGLSATLNNIELSYTTGILEIREAGVYTLTVFGLESTEVITAEFRELVNQVYLPLMLKGF